MKAAGEMDNYKTKYKSADQMVQATIQRENDYQLAVCSGDVQKNLWDAVEQLGRLGILALIPFSGGLLYWLVEGGRGGLGPLYLGLLGSAGLIIILQGLRNYTRPKGHRLGHAIIRHGDTVTIICDVVVSTDHTVCFRTAHHRPLSSIKKRKWDAPVGEGGLYIKSTSKSLKANLVETSENIQIQNAYLCNVVSLDEMTSLIFGN